MFSSFVDFVPVPRMAVMILAAAVLAYASQAVQTASASADRFAGQWTGTYTGDDSGVVTVTLTLNADGQHQGSISATRDQGGSYDIPFKGVAFDTDRMTAKYDWPEGGEVRLEATFSENDVSGTWSFADPAGTTAGGTWKAWRQTAQE
jgi:hypothetical protein